MFCGKCGNRIPDGAAFCPNCGNSTGSTPRQPQQTQQPQAPTQQAQQPQTQAQQPQTQAQPQPTMQYDTQYYTPAPAKKAKTNTIIGIVAVALVVIALVVAAILIFGGSGNGSKTAEAAAEKFFDAYVELDADAMYDCFSKDMLKAVAEDEYDGDMKELKEDLIGEFEAAFSMLDEMKLSYKIADDEKLEDDDFEDLRDDYLDEYDIKITDAVKVTIELTAKGTLFDEEYDTTNEIHIITFKIDGKWYVNPADVM